MKNRIVAAVGIGMSIVLMNAGGYAAGYGWPAAINMTIYPLEKSDEFRGGFLELRANTTNDISQLAVNEDIKPSYQLGSSMPESVSIMVRERFYSINMRDEAVACEGGYVGDNLVYDTVLTFYPATRSMVVKERRCGNGAFAKVERMVEMHPLHRYVQVFAIVMDKLRQQGESERLDSLDRYGYMYSTAQNLPVYYDKVTLYFRNDNELVYWQLVGNPVQQPERVHLVKKLLFLNTMQQVTLTDRAWYDMHGSRADSVPQQSGGVGENAAVTAVGEEAKALARLKFFATESREWVERYNQFLL